MITEKLGALREWLAQLAAENGGQGAAKSEPKGYISARVYHRKTDTWEDLGIISKPKGKG